MIGSSFSTITGYLNNLLYNTPDTKSTLSMIEGYQNNPFYSDEIDKEWTIEDTIEVRTSEAAKTRGQQAKESIGVLKCLGVSKSLSLLNRVAALAEYGAFCFENKAAKKFEWIISLSTHFEGFEGIPKAIRNITQELPLDELYIATTAISALATCFDIKNRRKFQQTLRSKKLEDLTKKEPKDSNLSEEEKTLRNMNILTLQKCRWIHENYFTLPQENKLNLEKYINKHISHIAGEEISQKDKFKTFERMKKEYLSQRYASLEKRVGEKIAVKLSKKLPKILLKLKSENPEKIKLARISAKNIIDLASTGSSKEMTYSALKLAGIIALVVTGILFSPHFALVILGIAATAALTAVLAIGAFELLTTDDRWTVIKEGFLNFTTHFYPSSAAEGAFGAA